MQSKLYTVDTYDIVLMVPNTVKPNPSLPTCENSSIYLLFSMNLLNNPCAQTVRHGYEAKKVNTLLFSWFIVNLQKRLIIINKSRYTFQL